MIKVASFLNRTLTENEKVVLELILKNEVSIVPLEKGKTNLRNRRSGDIIKRIPYDCDVVIIKTHGCIAREISELTNLTIVQYRYVSDEQFHKVYKPWHVFRNGGIVLSF